MTTRRFSAIAAGMVIAALLTGAASAAEVKLKAASFLPARVVYAKYFYSWVNEVNKRCAGKVKISVVGPAAIKSLEQWNALKTGVIDMHFGPPNYYKGTMVEGDVTSLSNVSSAEQRKNGAWAIINELHNERMNAWYLTHIIDGVKFFLYTSKPHENGRFEGFRLRSVPIYDAFFKSLGAQPVRMAPPAVYTALERNIVDGYGWPLWGVTDFGWDKYTKYRHGPGFFSAVVNILVNLDRWNGLPDGHRKCLTDMAIWLEAEWPAWRAAENDTQLAGQEKAGIKYVDLGPNFPKTAHGLHWDALMKANPEVIGKLRTLLVK
ncbi:MAG: ABC transporter substrate-binding protein [Anaerolineae bacterium]